MNNQSLNEKQTSAPRPRLNAWLAAMMMRDPGRWSSRLGALVSWMKMIGRGGRRRFGRAAAGVLAGASGIALMALLAGPMAPSVHAASINVDATCSLVDAIKSANTDTAVGTCEAGSGDDTIVLSGDVELTSSAGYYYESGTGLPMITSTMTIESATDEHYTISRAAAAAPFRIFAVNADGDLTLRNLTVSNGDAVGRGNYYGWGGAIRMESGKVTLDSVIISGNSANGEGGGVMVTRYWQNTDAPIPELVVTNSVFTNNVTRNFDGGAIGVESAGIITITNSLVISNSSLTDSGGGIYFDGTRMFIEDSTISNNHAGNSAGGGGLYIKDNATINNTTIISNSTPGDGGAFKVSNNTTRLYLNHVTLSDNYAGSEGGAVYSSQATAVFRNSIISGNRQSSASDNEVDEDSGTIKIYDSVLGHAGQTYIQAFSSITIDPSNTIATSDRDNIALDAIIDTTPADNGGPTLPGGYVMLTHLLPKGSPAIDKTAEPCLLEVDQRGVDRPQGVGCDAGAIEFEPVPVAFVSTLAAGTMGDLAYGPHDILRYDTETQTWTKWFSGTAAGLNPTTRFKHNINAIWISDVQAGEFAVSFAQNQQKIGTLGWVDGYDILRWDGTAFSRWFEGEQVGLTMKTQEKIDALHVLEKIPAGSAFAGQACEAYILISTQGPGAVRTAAPPPANRLKFGGEDILGFCATNLGVFTTGKWEMVMDGSAMVPKLPANSVDGISVDRRGTTAYATVKRPLPLRSQIFVYDFAAKTVSGPLLSIANAGLTSPTDALQIEGELELD